MWDYFKEGRIRRAGWILSAGLLPLCVLLASCQARPGGMKALPFPHAETWLNVTRPLDRKMLRGRAVLLDFFTPGCINCIQMIPVLHRLEQHFHHDFIVVSIDSPKFTASATLADLRTFILDFHVHEPVLDDTRLSLWNRYGVEAWPTFILINPQGRLVTAFVGEISYDRLATAIQAVIGKARRSGTLDPHPLPLKRLERPAGLLFAPDKVAVGGRWIAIADSGDHQVLLANRKGQVVQVIGSGKPGWKDGMEHAAEFDDPEGMAFGTHSLYVADAGSNTIRRVSLRNFRVTTLAGTGHRAYDVTGHGPARAVPLNSPWALEKSGRILWIAMAGEHQIWRLNLATGEIEAWAGTGDEGMADGSRREATFAQPSGLALTPGTLYDADPESSSIRVISIRSGHVGTLVGQGLFHWGFRNGSLSQAKLQHVQGLALEGRMLYVADTFNNAIRAINLADGQVSTLARGSLLNLPGGLALLNRTTLLIADTGANRILALDLKTDQLRPFPLTSKPGSPSRGATPAP
jgi:thiol-disulfide isomerase/thioredoxin